MQGEAPQFHQLAPEGAQPRPPEREGEEHRRGRRNRGGRDRNRSDRPRDEQGAVPASIIEEQRRIHALEAQREQERKAEETRAEEPRHQEPQREEPRHAEPAREEPRHEEPGRQEPRFEPAPPRAQEPRIDPKELLESAGLVMIETDRSKAAVQVVEGEAVHLGRPRRERPKPQQDDELQQVETKR